MNHKIMFHNMKIFSYLEFYRTTGAGEVEKRKSAFMLLKSSNHSPNKKEFEFSLFYHEINEMTRKHFVLFSAISW